MKRLGRLAPVLLCLLLAACAISTETVASGPQVTPVPTVLAPHRPPVLVQYCVDNTGSYPRYDFQNANALVASSLQASVTANSDGLNLYATAITSDTFNSANTLAPFIIPAIPNYPALPVIPTPSQENPVSYSATATAVADAQGAAIASYNTRMGAVNAQIQSTRAQVAQDAKRLTTWNPAVDASATSVWGCLQLARQRFTGQAGTKYLIIASDMQNNTGVDYTADFESSKALKGVAVRVIYYVCQSAGACEGLQSTWKQVFSASGATTAQFDDPAQSQTITNLFGGS